MNNTPAELAKMNVGYYFTAFNRRCQVVSTATFSGVVHYGFMTVDGSTPILGWIPVAFIGGCELTK